MENPQINPLPHEPQMPHAEKSQAGTNLAIVILVLVIVVVGVKLFMSSAPVEAPITDAEATSTEAASGVADTVAESTSTGEISMPAQQEASVITAVIPEGRGEAVFSVSSPRAIAVREMYVHNPYRAGDGDREWVRVYDGYKLIAAGETVEVFTASLASLTYDKIRIRAISMETGAPEETVKDMAITVMAKTSTPIAISL